MSNNLSKLIVDNDHALDRILESRNLDKYELIDLWMEQPGDSSYERTGCGMAPTSDTISLIVCQLPRVEQKLTRDVYPLPLPNDIQDWQLGSTVFTKLDL